MNTNLKVIMIGILSLGGLAAAVHGQTAEQIIDRYVDAIGGRTRLESIQTMIIEQVTPRPGGEGERRATTRLKRPNLMQVESTSAGRPAMRMAYDGKNVFMVLGAPGSGSTPASRVLPPDSPIAARIRQNTHIYQHLGSVIDYQSGGFKVEYLGAGSVEGIGTQRVKVAYPNGRQEELDFEKSTGLLIKIQARDEQDRIHSSIRSDFRSVQGILFPFKLKNIGPLPNDPNGITLVDIVDIRLNVPMTDDLFRLPSSIMTQVTAPAAAQDQSVQAVEKLVDVGGYNLNFRIILGQGSAILLESGGGLDSTEWNALAPRLAQETGATVISYDRAGFGKSDLPETKYDLREDTAALWRGLTTLGLDRNLILVGHSYGGFLIRFEAAEHPEAVRGLVFVDPFTVEFVDMFGIEDCNNHPMMGKLPFDTSRPETLSKVQRAAVRMAGAPDSNLADKISVMRKAVIPEGIPVRVITAGMAFLPKPEEQKVWRESHERFTASMKGAILVVAEKSGHMIPYSQPSLLVSVVSEVLRLTK